MPLPTTTRKVNYLNNRDILKEIHKSKITYCSFANKDTDHQFDVIVSDLGKINKTRIKEAIESRIERHKRETGEVLKPSQVPITDLVFRLMTRAHIPLVPKKETKAQQKKKLKLSEIFEFDEIGADNEDLTDIDNTTTAKVNFPPFDQFKITSDGVPYLVGRSHWKGGLDSGEFCIDHGQITTKLATMFIKLCERYATRSNWRGYCVDTETEALTQRGWLGINQITDNDTILSYSNKNLTWSSIKSIYRNDYNGPMHYITSRSIDSLITPKHKLVTARGLVEVELVKQSDQVIVMGNAVSAPAEKTFTDSFVELAGWIMTEGNYQTEKQLVTVYQNPGVKADRIRKCLTTLGFKFSEALQKKNLSFLLSRPASNEIFKIFPVKNLTMDFILKLTQDQRELLINTMLAGDGWRRTGGHMSYCQKDKEHIDLFQALLTMSGKKSNYHYVTDHPAAGKLVNFYSINIFSKRGNKTLGACLNFNGGLNNGKGLDRSQGKVAFPNVPTVPYNGQVWCPETEYGNFVARRNGKVYLTGNTYNEEMRGQALLQLSQIGLQFDESKSQNPFAYYTAAITNSFTRVLNLEKKNQNIRDDILEMNGLNPSWSRQNSGPGAVIRPATVTYIQVDTE